MSESEIRKNIKRRLDRIHNMKLLKAIETLLEGFEKEDAGDWWETISEEERKAIDEGIEQLKRGESHDYEEVRAEIKKKHGI